MAPRGVVARGRWVLGTWFGVDELGVGHRGARLPAANGLVGGDISLAPRGATGSPRFRVSHRAGGKRRRLAGGLVALVAVLGAGAPWSSGAAGAQTTTPTTAPTTTSAQGGASPPPALGGGNGVHHAFVIKGYAASLSGCEDERPDNPVLRIGRDATSTIIGDMWLDGGVLHASQNRYGSDANTDGTGVLRRGGSFHIDYVPSEIRTVDGTIGAPDPGNHQTPITAATWTAPYPGGASTCLIHYVSTDGSVNLGHGGFGVRFTTHARLKDAIAGFEALDKKLDTDLRDIQQGDMTFGAAKLAARQLSSRLSHIEFFLFPDIYGVNFGTITSDLIGIDQSLVDTIRKRHGVVDEQLGNAVKKTENLREALAGKAGAEPIDVALEQLRTYLNEQKEIAASGLKAEALKRRIYEAMDMKHALLKLFPPSFDIPYQKLYDLVFDVTQPLDSAGYSNRPKNAEAIVTLLGIARKKKALLVKELKS